MAKAVKAVGTAIMIVGAVVATGGMALAMGAGVGLLGSASLATSAVLSVGSFSVSAGALLSVGSLVSSIGGSLSQPKVSSAGGALGWVGDPNGPLHFAAGRIAVGGDLRHKAAYGPNDRMYFSAVTVVSDAGPIDAFESFTANEIPVTFDASGKANSSYYANVMWRRTQLGFQPEGSYLASPSGLQGGASLPNWGASHKLSGKAAFILTLSENSKQSAYKGQYPKPRTIIRGLRVYDWRRDSTYPGGSGPQRLNDPSTWAYSANPILWSVKWLLGLWEGPNGKGAPQVDYQVGGIGTRWENIDVAAFTEAANIADTHGWTCAAWPSTDDDKAQVLDAFLQAGGAYYIERAGKASCIHRAAPRVSVATITAADTAGPIELDTSASYLDRKNTGVATYLSEADGWKMTALPEVSSSQWVTEDGGRKRSVPVTYSYVDKAKQAAELICLGLAHTREGISGRIPLKSYMQGIGPGSAFTITEPEFVLDGLKCLCLETNYDANTGVHTVTFVSETDAKYPYAFGQTPSPPPPPALTPVDPTHVSPPLPGDWTIAPRPPAPGGGQLPGFDLGGIVSNETATAVIVEHGPTDTGPWTQAYQGPPTVTNIPIDGLQPGATYYIAVQYQRDQNYSERYVYGPYTAPNLEPSHLNTEPVQDVLDRLTNTATLADQNRQAVEALEEVYGDTASAATSAAAAAASEAAATQAKADALIAKAGAESSASAAQTAKTAAETARAGAETAQSSAANSATTATGAAATATTQAGIATTAKNDAQAASSAAVTAKDQASSFADAAGVSAAASQASSVTATAAKDGAVGAAIQSVPFVPSPDTWTNVAAAGGAPETRASAPASSIVNGTIAPPTGSVSAWAPKQYVRWETGRILELSMEVSAPAGNPDSRARFVVARFDGSYASLSAVGYLGAGTVPAGDKTTIKLKVGMGVNVPDGINFSQNAAEWVSIGVQLNINAVGAQAATSKQTLLRFGWTDITAQTASETSASAAATSASSAAASETAAGQSASAASTAKTQAETARGQAQTAATQAASSRDDAAGSAASASSSATNAASSRDAAAGSAMAAAGSASTANTKATDAGNSASAAQASQVAATAAKDAAETARGQAQSSASAAATSASSAAASETAAGQSASAASGSATTAATRAGEALTYRNQAASSATDAKGSANTATTASGTAVAAKNDAQAAAATATSQSSSASASAASAQISANLAAQIGGGSLNQNPSFAAWIASGAVGPDNWTAVSGANGTLSKGPGTNGMPQSLRTASYGTAEFGVNSATFSGAFGGEWLVLTAELTLVSGDMRGVGVTLHRRQNGAWVSSVNLNLATENDAAGNVAGSGVAGRRYSFTKLIDGRGASINGYSVLGWARQVSLSPVGAATIDWHRLAVRIATAEEVATGTVLPVVDARASLALSTSVDAVTRLGQAAFELILASGGNPAYIKALAGPGGSEIAFAATKLLLRNVVGDQIVTALELLNGEAYFGAPVSVDISGRRLTIGPGFGVSSGLVLWFGPNTVSLASMSRTNGYFALGTDGKVYYGSAELGDGGGNPSALIVGPSTTTGGGSGAIPTNYATIGSVAFANVPAGGVYEVNPAIMAPSGAAVSGAGVFTGSLRIVEVKGGTTHVVYGPVPFTADQHGIPGGLIDVNFVPPDGPMTQTESGAVTLAVQIARTSGSTTVSGLRTTVTAKWTKKG